MFPFSSYDVSIGRPKSQCLRSGPLHSKAPHFAFALLDPLSTYLDISRWPRLRLPTRMACSLRATYLDYLWSSRWFVQRPTTTTVSNIPLLAACPVAFDGGPKTLTNKWQEQLSCLQCCWRGAPLEKQHLCSQMQSWVIRCKSSASVPCLLQLLRTAIIGCVFVILGSHSSSTLLLHSPVALSPQPQQHDSPENPPFLFLRTVLI